MNRKKICIVTTARSEYGLLQNIIRQVRDDKELQLQLVVGGAHLCAEQGHTYKMIEQDGYKITAKLDYLKYDDSSKGLVKSIGLCTQQCAEVFNELCPHLLVVLGDRYELLPICSAALLMHIPIAHLSGGDVTLGAIDNQVRNMVTMIADIHFPGSEESANRIHRMVGNNAYVYNVGEPGIENLARSNFIGRTELAEQLYLDISKKWFLVTLHPETKENINYNMLMARKMMESIMSAKEEVIVTYANADEGGVQMNAYYEECAKRNPNVHVCKSLGQLRYNSMMKEAWCVVGNSSSGVIEAPFLGKPVINIGNRQLGRHMCANIINVPLFDANQIDLAIQDVEKMACYPDYYYGDGHVATKVVAILKQYLNK